MVYHNKYGTSQKAGRNSRKMENSYSHVWWYGIWKGGGVSGWQNWRKENKWAAFCSFGLVKSKTIARTLWLWIDLICGDYPQGNTDTINMLFCNSVDVRAFSYAKSFTSNIKLLFLQISSGFTCARFSVVQVCSHLCAAKREYNFHEHSSLSQSKTSTMDSILLL